MSFRISSKVIKGLIPPFVIKKKKGKQGGQSGREVAWLLLGGAREVG